MTIALQLSQIKTMQDFADTWDHAVAKWDELSEVDNYDRLYYTYDAELTSAELNQKAEIDEWRQFVYDLQKFDKSQLEDYERR